MLGKGCKVAKLYTNKRNQLYLDLLENLAVYCRASEGESEGVGGLVDATPQNPQQCKILWRSVEKCRR